MRAVAAGVTALVLLAAIGGPAAAQVGDSAAAPPAATPRVATGGWGAVSLAPRPGSPIAAVTLAFPHGSADDPDDRSGATWLLGQVVREEVLGGLDPAARASTEIVVEVERSHTVVRMVTLPRYLEVAWGVLEWALLDATPSELSMERARAELREVFAFESDAPHREFEVELYRLLAGLDSPWSRLPRGDLSTVEEMTVAELTAFRDATVRREEGTLAWVGGGSPAAVARTLTGGGLPDPAGVVSAGFTPLSTRSLAPETWESEDRVELLREVTSSWIGVAWPFDPATPPTAREMLVDRLDRQFNSTPPDPGAFDVDVRIELMGSREILVVEAAVVPESATQWERRIRSAVVRIAEEEMGGPFFRAYRRRFRGSRLLRDALPEVESLRRAMELLLTGEVRELPARISAMDARALARAAATLGAPRTFVLGPDLSDGS